MVRAARAVQRRRADARPGTLAGERGAPYNLVMTSDRREFLTRAAMAAAAASLLAPSSALAEPGGAGAAAPAPRRSRGAARSLDAPLAAAVGEAVLPESLGPEGRAAASAAFLAWVADYRPVTEEMHGYGDAEITYTPSDPAPGWNAQLAGLDLLARARHRRAFAELSVARRREVLGLQLERVPGTRLPGNPLAAGHVAIALLAHWASSAAATDLAYEARIGKGSCRALAETTRRPLPIAGERAR